MRLGGVRIPDAAKHAGRWKSAVENYGFFKTILDIAKDSLGLLGFLFPWAFGVFGQDSAQRLALDIAAMSLPVRLLATLAVAAILGIGLGYAANWLTRRDGHLTVWIAGLLAGGWAVLLVVAVETFSASGDRVLPEFSLFLACALSLSMLLLGAQLSARRGAVTAERVKDRSTIVLIYAGGAVTVALLVRLGQLG